MGFKKTTKKEDEFIENARGETSNLTPKKQKRSKTFLMYFTNDEFERVSIEAQNIGMGINQYIRFKIFS